MLHDDDHNECLTLTDRLENNIFRPEYVVLNEFTSNDNFYSYEACLHKFNSLNMYDLERTYSSELGRKGNEKYGRYLRKSFLYKLKPSFSPL